MTYIQKYVCEIEYITRLNRILNYVSKEYVKDSGRTEARSDSVEWIRYKAALDAVYKVDDPEKIGADRAFCSRPGRYQQERRQRE